MINAETKSEREMWLNKVRADLENVTETSKPHSSAPKTPWILLLFILANHILRSSY